MQSFQKPENALKRANELLSIGQRDAALKILHNAIGHRRFRSQGWDAVQEAIMMKHVQLCIEEGKLRLAREGLHQYRVISQHANIQSLGKVVAELRSRAEAKLASAKAKAGEEEGAIRQSLEREDLDVEGESPEALMLSTLQVEVRSPEARDVHLALRAEWDVYKMILDLLRTTPKLERVYHETARRAFAFCRENKRPQEFKRLCDVLRAHFALVLKNRTKEDYDALLKPELHLETRILQLVVAGDLGLWRECAATADDLVALGLHEHFVRSLRSGIEIFPKSREKLLRWMAVYYEKISKVMWGAENYLFHALALVKLFLHVKGFKRHVPAEQLQAMASEAVLAVLSIPPSGSDKAQSLFAGEQCSPSGYEQHRHLAALLNHTNVPTREGMALVLKAKDIVTIADPVCQELFTLLEADCTPLKLCSQCQPLLNRVAEIPHLEMFILPLKRVIFQKLIQQISRVYVSLSIDYFTTHICTSEFLSWPDAEKLLVALVQPSPSGSSGLGDPLDSLAPEAAPLALDGGVQVRIDYSSRALIFQTSEVSAERTIRQQIVTLAKVLDKAVREIQPTSEEDEMERQLYAQNISARLQAEAQKMSERMRRTNLRRLEKLEEQQRLEEEKRRREAEQRRVEEKQERDRREEACKRRVEKRQQEERIKARSETAALMLDEIRKIGGKDNKILIKGKQLTDINIKDVLEGTVDYNDLEKAQRLQLNKERLNRVRQRRANFRRVCHFIRACREEERPLLEQWREDQLKKDTEILLQLQTRHEEEHKAAVAAALEEKAAFSAMVAEKAQWTEARMQRRREEFAIAAQQQRERLRRMLVAEKIQRAIERRDEAVRKAREEAEAKRAEEERKRILEEMERQKAEEQAKAKRLAEVAELQRKRELAIEEQLEQQRQALREEASKNTSPKPERMEWRRSQASNSTSSPAPGAGGRGVGREGGEVDMALRSPHFRRERRQQHSQVDDDTSNWRSSGNTANRATSNRQDDAPIRRAPATQPGSSSPASQQQQPGSTDSPPPSREEEEDGFTFVNRRR